MRDPDAIAEGRVARNRRRYDRLAGLYERIVRSGAFRSLHRAVANAIEPVPGGTIVDLGCGPGALVPHLLSKVGESGSVVGVDVSDRMLERARRRALRHGWRNVRFERADAGHFSPEAPVDVVVFCLTVSTMPEPERRLEQAASWLRPGGQLVVLDSFPDESRRLASLVIRGKAPWVGALPSRAPLDWLRDHLDGVRIRHLQRGVYTLASGRKRGERGRAARP